VFMQPEEHHRGGTSMRLSAMESGSTLALYGWTP
jgi:hypothetical protein